MEMNAFKQGLLGVLTKLSRSHYFVSKVSNNEALIALVVKNKVIYLLSSFLPGSSSVFSRCRAYCRLIRIFKPHLY